MARVLFIALLAFVASGSGDASAQPAVRKRVGVIFNSPPMSELQEPSPTNRPAQAMRDELAKAGWRPGHNVEILWRSAESDFDRFPAIVDELVQRKVDVFVVGHPKLAAMIRTRAPGVPVVMNASFDLVSSGLVERLSRPGGNITGVQTKHSGDLFMKRLEVLRELVPGVSRVAILCCIGHRRERDWGTALKPRNKEWASSRHRDIALLSYQVQSADEIEAAMEHAAGMKVQAILVENCAACYLTPVQQRFHAAARKHRLPSMHEWLNAVETGALVGYGVESDLSFRRTAYYAARILNGEKPAELPIETMDNLKLHVNRSTAAAIGLTIPQSILVRADKIFE